MPVYRLDDRLEFPHPDLAEDNGLLAVGGDLSPKRLLLAYAHGIFPWYEDGLPILWHSPDPRTVLVIDALHVPRSLRKTLRRGRLDLRLDTAFAAVIEGCAAAARPDQDGTWITHDMIDAYVRLHELGFAHSAEAWIDGSLTGGLYGVSLGRVFFGESMFTKVNDASKAAFVTLVEQLRRWGLSLVDCQMHTDHLARFGAVDWPRARYLAQLARLVDGPTRRGRWRLDSDLASPGRHDG